MSQTQPDLFHMDSPLYGEVRGERSIMAFPFFALTKIAQMKALEYSIGNVSIEVRPSASGVATIYDKEIVLYIASLMVSKMEAGQAVEQDFTFTAHDFFRVTGTSSSSRSYDRLSDALERLQGTQIRTNIEAGGEGEEGWFSWLSEAKTQYTRGKNGEKRLKAVRVRLCDWLYRAIIKDRRILTYHLDYFRLGPIERRLYELARSHCEEGNSYEVGMDVLRCQVGSQDTLPRFKQALKAIAEADTMPEYHVRLHEMVAPPELSLEDGGQKKRRGRRQVETIVEITPRPKPLPRWPQVGVGLQAAA